MNLRPHQQEALNKIRSIQGGDFLLADDVGLGKTRIACCYAMDFKKTLIVAPLSTIPGWLNEAKEVGLKLGRAIAVWPEDCDAVIVNYDRLTKFPENICKASGKTIFSYIFDRIIWDESQFLKSYKSKRHKVWDSISTAAGGNLYLSATPAQNPLEMKYLHGVINIPKHGFWSWVKTFRGVVQPRWGGFAFQHGYKADKERLSGILNGERSIRRTPKEIQGWPEVTRIIDPINLNASESSHYSNAYRDYASQIRDVGGRVNSKVAQLVAVGQFKQRISELKLKYTLQKIKDLTEQGMVVTVSCEYLASVNWLSENLPGLKVALITGETSGEERSKIFSASNSDLLDVIIFTVKEGVNFHQILDEHRPRAQINHDLRWSAMDIHQIEGRTNRAGRYAPVYWMTCRDTIDDKISKILKGKMDSMSGMLEKFDIDPILSIDTV